MNTRVIKAEDTRKMDRERTELNTCHCHPLGIPRWLLCPGIGLGGQATSSHSSLMKTKCFQNHRGRLPWALGLPYWLNKIEALGNLILTFYFFFFWPDSVQSWRSLYFSSIHEMVVIIYTSFFKKADVCSALSTVAVTVVRLKTNCWKQTQARGSPLPALGRCLCHDLWFPCFLALC